MLYLYGLKIGLKLLSYGKVKDALPYLFRPVIYWRNVEYNTVLSEAGFQPGEKVLDIGSPKLLAVYLADKLGLKVYATDIEDYFIRRLHLIRLIKHIPSSRLHLQVEDGRKLSFDDNSLDKVYSISVLEHIPENGDTACVQEMNRVLVKGGRAIITVPFSPASKTEYKEEFYWSRSSSVEDSGKTFYQRRYSEEDLCTRLIQPSGLRLKKLGFIGEKILTNSPREFSEYLPAVTGPLHPLLSNVFHTTMVDSWQDIKKPLCAVIVLEK